MAAYKTIHEALQMLGVHYGANKSDDEMAILTATWGDDFSEVSDQEFIEAVREFRKRSKFFPKSAEVLDIVEELRMRPKQGQRALPNDPFHVSPEQAERNTSRGKLVCDAILRKDPEAIRKLRERRNGQYPQETREDAARQTSASQRSQGLAQGVTSPPDSTP